MIEECTLVAEWKDFLKKLCRNLVGIRRYSLRGRGLQIFNTGKKKVRHTKIYNDGANNRIIFEGEGIIRCRISITGSNNIVRVREGSSIYDGTICIEDDGNKVIIGKNTQLCGKIQLVCMEGTRIVVGDDCLFSSDITFRTGDSHSILDLSGRRTNLSRDIIIGSHVWVCHKVIMNKGVKVRNNSVIATGSVVTKSITEENVVAAGNPAQIVKRNIRWESSRIKVKSKREGTAWE